MFQNYFLLFKFVEENLVFIFPKYLKKTMNAILNGGKTLRESPKKIFVRKIHYSKYQLIKSIHKIITSLFPQKLLEANRNSGIQAN